MPKFILTLTDELQDALRTEAERRNTTIAALIREYVVKGLAENGIVVKQRVKWGGRRERRKPTNDETES